MEELMFYQWVKILIYLYNHQDDGRITLWCISKDLDIASSASIVNIIKIFVKKGVVKVERKGRNNSYIVTSKGQRIAEYLQKVLVEL